MCVGFNASQIGFSVFSSMFSVLLLTMVFFQAGAEKAVPVMLVANKVDLRSEPESHKIYVTHDDGQRVARVSALLRHA